MKFLLLLPLLLFPLGHGQDVSVSEQSPVPVVSSKWSQSQRVTFDDSVSLSESPSGDVVPARSGIERRKVSDTADGREPSSDPFYKGAADTEKASDKPGGAKVSRTDGYLYQAKVLNAGAKTVRTVFWEFKFTEKANTANVSQKQFVCRAEIKPEKTKVLEIFSRSGPTSVVSVDSLKKSAEVKFESTVIINRVEYDDGSAWQRAGWNYDEVKLTAKPSETRTPQPCRGL